MHFLHVSRILFFVAALAVASSPARAAFEGKVEMKFTDVKNKSDMLMKYFVKGTKLRMDTETPPDKKGRSMLMSSIVDWTTRESLMLMHEQKMCMAMKLPDPQAVNDSMKKKGDTDFKPTGRKEKIAGVEAEEYTAISGGKWTEIWVTKEMGKFFMNQQGKGGGLFGKGKDGSDAWQKFMEKGEFFALRMIQRAKEGAPEDFRMEATKVEKGSQPDDLFAVPAGYQRIENPGLGGALKGLIPKL